MEAKMAGDEREAGMVLESHHLSQLQNYSMRTAVVVKKLWTTLMAISVTGTGTILFREEFIMKTPTPLMRTVKESCLRSA